MQRMQDSVDVMSFPKYIVGRGGEGEYGLYEKETDTFVSGSGLGMILMRYFES